jgi:hypothetical protein
LNEKDLKSEENNTSGHVSDVGHGSGKKDDGGKSSQLERKSHDNVKSDEVFFCLIPSTFI